MPLGDAADALTVFVSYAHADNESTDASKRWLNRLLEQLQPLVLQDKVTAWSDKKIEAGGRWDESIKTELRSAKVFVLLVSPAFLASEYIRNSELPVLLMNAMNEGATVLPVILRHCAFAETKFKYPDPEHGPQELSLAIFQSANPPDKPLNSMLEHEQDKVLLSVAQRVLSIAAEHSARRTPDAAAGSTRAVWHLAHPRNPFFTGREQTLEDIRRTLAEDGKAALSGMGGVGKTQTAVEYAYRHRGEYAAVLLTRADTEDALKSGLAAMATTLNLREQSETDRDVIVTAVKRWLEGNAGWLLILDNADDLSLVSDLTRRDWQGHLLLTTRAHATGVVGRVEIKEMPPEEGALFLLRRSKFIGLEDTLASATEPDQNLATEISREVGDLPLALDQAGAFIEEMSSSLAEYLDLYRKEGAELRAARGGVAPDHEPVTITFSLAFRQVESASAAAGDMLRACAFLAPDAIPEEIFIAGAEELGDNLAPMSDGGIALVKMLGDAARFSLIRRDPKNGTIQIHRLVQQVLKDEMDTPTRRLWAERTVRALSKAFLGWEYEHWPLCEKLLPHAQEAARLIEEYSFEFAEAARLLQRTGLYCIARAQYAEAEPLCRRSVSIWEKVFGPDHPQVAFALNNLAYLYEDQGRYAEAEPLYIRSLAIREAAIGPDDPQVALGLNNLAYFYYNQGRYAEAEPLYMRALNIFANTLGPDDPQLATGLNNLALLYKSQGKHAEAETLHKRALGIREKVLGPEHLDVAVSFSNLASLYRNQGRDAEAEPLYVRALSIFENVLGPAHPQVATVLNNLAIFYTSQGKYAEAEPLHERALSIREEVLGPEHPDTALSLHNLGLLYGVQGKYAEAEPRLARALRIWEEALGPTHPNSVTMRENYTELLRRRGRKTEG